MQNSPQQRNRKGGTKQEMHSAGPQSKHALNCIVDDSALLAGLNTPNGLKQWVRDGSVNVFIPLYTLERLNMLRSSPPPVNLQVRKILEWLDDITSATESVSSGRVELQGPDDQYQTWAEVEKYLLPDTPLSSLGGTDNLDGVAEDLGALCVEESKKQPDSTHGEDFGSNVSSVTETTRSPFNSFGDGRPTSQERNGRNHSRNLSQASATSFLSQSGEVDGNENTGSPPTGTADIPSSVRPLLNFVVWRTYHEDTSIAGTRKYILLTNDPTTQKQAQKFGVRAKLVSQLRTVFSKGDYKRSSQLGAKAGNSEELERGDPSSTFNDTFATEERAEAEEADEVVFNPSQRPGSSRSANHTPHVWDPDHFGRTQASAVLEVHNEPTTTHKPFTRGKNRHLSIGTETKRGSNPRGGRSPRSPRLRGHAPPPRGQTQQNYPQPIDPDSYARPAPNVKRGGRGSVRRLFDPNS